MMFGKGYQSLILGVTLLVLLLSPIGSTTLYVDHLINSASCSTYNPGNRSCAGGTETAFRTLTAAVSAVQPGDVVLLRQGHYGERLQVLVSGNADQPIIIRAYPSELVTIASSSSPATIVLNQVSYIEIEGFTIQDVRWAEITNCQHITLRNNRFLRTPSSGTTGNVRFISSDHNRIINNLLEEGNDNLLLIDSDYNLVTGNTMREGRHSIFSIRCANYNIIRNNTFSNTIQKIGEIYDCGEDTTAVPHSFNATRHNLIEGNVFADANAYYSTSGGNGIQYAGQEGIIRHNLFYQTNVGLGMQVYSDEALYNHHNRIYHNVFFNNDCAGVASSGSVVGNVFVNNILFQNKGIGGGDCFGDGPAQIVYRSSVAGFVFRQNNIIYQNPGEAVVAIEFGQGQSLAHYQSSFPGSFFANLEQNPAFTAAESGDFHLSPGSPMIDTGAFLTTTQSAGQGLVMAVADTRYFCDGYGIEGEVGDQIQLAGQAQRFHIVALDYTANTITLDQAASWSAAQGLSLAYQGSCPDLGVFEFNGSGPSLQIISPNGDELWRRGEERVITWTANGVSGNLVIELLQNDNLVGAIASDVPAGNGTFTWMVGQLQNGSFVTGTNLKIRIRTAAGAVVVEQEIR